MDFNEIIANEEMSAEERIEALKKIKFPNMSEYVTKADYDKLKASLDGAAHDASEWKKKYNATLDENQKKEIEDAERVEAMQKELETYRKKSVVSDHTSRFLALGYTEEQAKKAAGYLYDGNTEKLFEIQKIVMDEKMAEMQSDLLDKTPQPFGNNGENASRKVTKDDLLKMTPAERMAFSNEHPEEYRQIYEGGN